MKLYAITNAAGHLLRYEGTQAEAKSAAKIAEADFDQAEVPTDKAGLIDHLNSLLVDRPQEDQFETVVERQDPPMQAGGIEVPTDVDEIWEGLPLARKAHFAALFCEEARSIIPALKTQDDVDEIVLQELDDAEDDVDPFA